MTWYLRNQKIATYALIHNVLDENILTTFENIILQDYPLRDAFTRGGEEANELDLKLRRSSVRWVEPTEKVDSYYRSLTDIVNDVNSSLFNYNLTYMENLQYTTYTENGLYNWHQDDPHEINGGEILEDKYGTMPRKLSFSLLLSDLNPDQGGEFQIKYSNDEIETLELKRGSIVFFPSFLVHRVSRLNYGERRSIVGWMRGPQWV